MPVRSRPGNPNAWRADRPSATGGRLAGDPLAPFQVTNLVEGARPREHLLEHRIERGRRPSGRREPSVILELRSERQADRDADVCQLQFPGDESQVLDRPDTAG